MLLFEQAPQFENHWPNSGPCSNGEGVTGVAVRASTMLSGSRDSNRSAWIPLAYWFSSFRGRSRGHTVAAAAPELMSICKEGRE